MRQSLFLIGYVGLLASLLFSKMWIHFFGILAVLLLWCIIVCPKDERRFNLE